MSTVRGTVLATLVAGLLSIPALAQAGPQEPATGPSNTPAPANFPCPEGFMENASAAAHAQLHTQHHPDGIPMMNGAGMGMSGTGMMGTGTPMGTAGMMGA